jgi:curved DNA-binding protein CbpA
VHRVYRLLAQRFHPDNHETGNEDRFRAITDAYRVLSDPEQRARYDLQHTEQQKDRWRVAARSLEIDNDFRAEQRLRSTVLEMLYTKRRMDPYRPGIFQAELEKLSGAPREHLEFTIWYLLQKKLAQRADNSLLVITVDGVDFVEAHVDAAAPRVGLLRAVNG